MNAVVAFTAVRPHEATPFLPAQERALIAQRLFAFEADYATSLCCMPMIVRYQLDVCRIKLSLHQWQSFSLFTRARLILDGTDHPATRRRYLRRLLTAIAREAGSAAVRMPPPQAREIWEQAAPPQRVLQNAANKGIALDGPRQWADLTALQRFTLYKLTRPGHENRNFPAALREFGLSAKRSCP